MTVLSNSNNSISVEGFRAGAVVSESSFSAIGQAINYLQGSIYSIGDVMATPLDETQFAAQHGSSWVICGGQSITGTDLYTLTGMTNAPDMSGRYPRGKDNGTGRDANGDLPTGSNYSDAQKDHYHSGSIFQFTGQFPFPVMYWWVSITGTQRPISADQSGRHGAETTPKTVIVNFFIKVNR